MARPDNYGAAGGVISLWVKVINCLGPCGIVSSHPLFGNRIGSFISYSSPAIRYDTHVFANIST